MEKRLNIMENKFLKLTNTVYRVLEFFPESDPLKNRAKDRALVIMEHLTLVNKTNGWMSFQKEKTKEQVTEDINVLLGYLWIGKSQGWLSATNCLIIANEYEKIKKEIEPVMELTQKLPLPITNFDSGAKETLREEKATKLMGGESGRQEKIIEFLSKNEKAQVMDLQTILPDVTKRTIRRDLDELLELGKITRQGDFNQVFYKLA